MAEKGLKRLRIGQALALSEVVDAQGGHARWVIGELHGAAPTCPYCGKLASDSLFALKTVHCRCGKKYGWRLGTIYEGSQLSPAQVLFLHLGIELKLKTATIAAWTGLSESTIYVWRLKLKTLGGVENEDRALEPG